MKKVFKVFFVTMVMVMCIGAVCVSASTESKIKKLVGKMKNYELALLYEFGDKLEGTKAINLNKDKMGRAAALSLKYSKSDRISLTDQGTAKVARYKINADTFKKAGINLFGKKLKLKNISSVNNNGMLDVFKTGEYGVIFYNFVYDTNTDYVVNNISIKEKNGKYIVDKSIYFGSADANKKVKAVSNFKIRYAVKANKKSAFKYVITGMKVTKIA